MYPYRRKRRGLRVAVTLLILLLLVAGGGTANYLRPLPLATANTSPISSEINAIHLTWPANSQSAIGAVGFGILTTHGPQSPLPTASLAKIITALAILQKKPLKVGAQGPLVTLGDDDVAIYNKYLQENGSVAKVASGEQISEYQMLQAMLLASANNMADSAAIWAFGSLDNYQKYATQLVHSYGLPDTTIGSDASGFAPSTTSTAQDFVQLGMRALQQPVIAQIVAQHQATIPVAGTIRNYDDAFAQDGVLAIKSGLSSQAHACYLYSTTLRLGGRDVLLVGASLGAPDLRSASAGAKQLLDTAKASFTVETPVTAGQTFGTYKTAWGAEATMQAATNITMVAWKGAPLTPKVQLSSTRGSMPKGAQVGTVVVSSKNNHGSATLTLQQAVPAPTFRWRLLRLW